MTGAVGSSSTRRRWSSAPRGGSRTRSTALRGRLRDLLLDEVRREELPRLEAANREVEALYEYSRRTGLNGFDVPPKEVASRQDEWRRIFERMSERERAQPDPTELIVIDEADRLKMTGLEQVRDIFDRGGVGVVLIGMPGLERRLARYAQLYSRIGFVHEFRPLGAAEVRTLLAGWRPSGVSLPEDLLADAEGVAALVRITGGNFRLLDRLLTQVGRILELNGLKVDDPRSGRGGARGPGHRRGVKRFDHGRADSSTE